MYRAGATALLLLLTTISVTAEEHLRVLYPEQPPFTFTNPDGSVHGERFERVRSAMRKAGFQPVFESVPGTRILALLRDDHDSFCSLSWYYTEERAAFALYTPPYYYDQLSVVIRRADGEHFRRYTQFADLLKSGELRLGLTSNLSNGGYVDGLLRKFGGKLITQRVENSAQLWQWLNEDRVDLVLRSAGELEYRQAQGEAGVATLTALQYPDLERAIPEYLMCSRHFGSERMMRLRQAIETMPKPGAEVENNARR